MLIKPISEYARDVAEVAPAGLQSTMRRKNRQLERAGQTMILKRLHALKLAAIIIPIPNSFFIPARSEAERQLARRLVHQLKVRGSLLPGAADIVLLWAAGCGCIEFKRQEEKDLFGKIPQGQLSQSQKDFKVECEKTKVPYEIVRSWAETLAVITKWGVPYLDPDSTWPPPGAL